MELSNFRSGISISSKSAAVKLTRVMIKIERKKLHEYFSILWTHQPDHFETNLSFGVNIIQNCIVKARAFHLDVAFTAIFEYALKNKVYEVNAPFAVFSLLRLENKQKSSALHTLMQFQQIPKKNVKLQVFINTICHIISLNISRSLSSLRSQVLMCTVDHQLKTELSLSTLQGKIQSMQQSNTQLEQKSNALHIAVSKLDSALIHRIRHYIAAIIKSKVGKRRILNLSQAFFSLKHYSNIKRSEHKSVELLISRVNRLALSLNFQILSSNLNFVSKRTKILLLSSTSILSSLNNQRVQHQQAIASNPNILDCQNTILPPSTTTATTITTTRVRSTVLKSLPSRQAVAMASKDALHDARARNALSVSKAKRFPPSTSSAQIAAKQSMHAIMYQEEGHENLLLEEEYEKPWIETTQQRKRSPGKVTRELVTQAIELSGAPSSNVASDCSQMITRQVNIHEGLLALTRIFERTDRRILTKNRGLSNFFMSLKAHHHIRRSSVLLTSIIFIIFNGVRRVSLKGTIAQWKQQCFVHDVLQSSFHLKVKSGATQLHLFFMRRAFSEIKCWWRHERCWLDLRDRVQLPNILLKSVGGALKRYLGVWKKDAKARTLRAIITKFAAVSAFVRTVERVFLTPNMIGVWRSQTRFLNHSRLVSHFELLAEETEKAQKCWSEAEVTLANLESSSKLRESHLIAALRTERGFSLFKKAIQHSLTSSRLLFFENLRIAFKRSRSNLDALLSNPDSVTQAVLHVQCAVQRVVELRRQFGFLKMQVHASRSKQGWRSMIQSANINLLLTEDRLYKLGNALSSPANIVRGLSLFQISRQVSALLLAWKVTHMPPTHVTRIIVSTLRELWSFREMVCDALSVLQVRNCANFPRSISTIRDIKVAADCQDLETSISPLSSPSARSQVVPGRTDHTIVSRDEFDVCFEFAHLHDGCGRRLLVGLKPEKVASQETIALVNEFSGQFVPSEMKDKLKIAKKEVFSEQEEASNLCWHVLHALAGVQMESLPVFVLESMLSTFKDDQESDFATFPPHVVRQVKNLLARCKNNDFADLSRCYATLRLICDEESFISHIASDPSYKNQISQGLHYTTKDNLPTRDLQNNSTVPQSFAHISCLLSRFDMACLKLSLIFHSKKSIALASTFNLIRSHSSSRIDRGMASLRMCGVGMSRLIKSLRGIQRRVARDALFQFTIAHNSQTPVDKINQNKSPFMSGLEAVSRVSDRKQLRGQKQRPQLDIYASSTRASLSIFIRVLNTKIIKPSRSIMKEFFAMSISFNDQPVAPPTPIGASNAYDSFLYEQQQVENDHDHDHGDGAKLLCHNNNSKSWTSIAKCYESTNQNNKNNQQNNLNNHLQQKQDFVKFKSNTETENQNHTSFISSQTLSPSNSIKQNSSDQMSNIDENSISIRSKSNSQIHRDRNNTGPSSNIAARNMMTTPATTSIYETLLAKTTAKDFMKTSVALNIKTSSGSVLKQSVNQYNENSSYQPNYASPHSRRSVQDLTPTRSTIKSIVVIGGSSNTQHKNLVKSDLNAGLITTTPTRARNTHQNNTNKRVPGNVSPIYSEITANAVDKEEMSILGGDGNNQKMIGTSGARRREISNSISSSNVSTRVPPPTMNSNSSYTKSSNHVNNRFYSNDGYDSISIKSHSVNSNILNDLNTNNYNINQSRKSQTTSSTKLVRTPKQSSYPPNPPIEQHVTANQYSDEMYNNLYVPDNDNDDNNEFAGNGAFTNLFQSHSPFSNNFNYDEINNKSNHKMKQSMQSSLGDTIFSQPAEIPRSLPSSHLNSKRSFKEIRSHNYRENDIHQRVMDENDELLRCSSSEPFSINDGKMLGRKIG